MSDIKIFVTHTPNRDTMRVNNSLLYNVIAGSDFQTKEVPEGVYQDNQGDNISSLNKSYCELTTQYWAWKNMQADYYGFCHYRRFFSFSVFSPYLVGCPSSTKSHISHDSGISIINTALGIFYSSLFCYSVA